jgi:hypothetical protein
MDAATQSLVRDTLVSISRGHVDYRSALAKFADIERRVAPTIADSQQRSIVLHEVSAARLTLAIEKEAPLSECRDYFDIMCGRGFLHPAHQSRWYIIYARHWLSRGEIGEVRSRLKPLLSELVASAELCNAEWCQRDIEYIRDILRQAGADGSIRSLCVTGRL